MADGMTIGQLAAAAGLTRSAIRYYEQLRLLPRAARTASGYRLFPAQSVRRLRLIRAARLFGFSLREIAQFVSTRDSGGVPCRAVREAGGRKLDALNEQIVALQRQRRSMRATLARWDEILAGASPYRPAYLLESLGEH